MNKSSSKTTDLDPWAAVQRRDRGGGVNLARGNGGLDEGWLTGRMVEFRVYSEVWVSRLIDRLAVRWREGKKFRATPDFVA